MNPFNPLLFPIHLEGDWHSLWELQGHLVSMKKLSEQFLGL